MRIFFQIIFFLSNICCWVCAQANVSTHFDQIKNDPNALYVFLKSMPKGGELHYHLEGGSSPELLLKLAARKEYCLEKPSFTVKKNLAQCSGVLTKNLMNDSELYSEVIKAWSMKDFVPGKESGHDHFFNAFRKYMPITMDHKSELLADIIRRAADQKVLYLEIMTIPDNANSAHFGDFLIENNSYADKKDYLLHNQAFQNNIKTTLNQLNEMISHTRKELDCDAQFDSAPCKVQVKFLYYVLREQALNNFFAQALQAFELASRSGDVVGVNSVQPEDGMISLRDYHQQMLILEYFHQLYPKVNISLHAGELAQDTVATEELRFHIRDAVLTGHAQRIGHGSDIAFEHDAEHTVTYMALHHIPVEICLSSSLKILGLSGLNHPMQYYLKHHVPIVLSTDDEGILRTDLTTQYVAAVRDQGIDYPTLKQINRNALTYSFLAGKSIWADAGKGILIQECQDFKSTQCQQVIQHSDKARVQVDLEQRLSAFESQFSH